MPYCALELMPNASCRESEDIRFQEARNSLNAEPPNTRDHPPTALCPLLKMSLEKSPDATGSLSTGGSCRTVFI